MIIGVQAVLTKLKAFVDNFNRTNTITTIVVTQSAGLYIVNGSNNATLSLYRGSTYIFEINASGHPFWIQTSSGAYNAANIVTSGITNGGAQVGNIIYQVPDDAPSTLYYACQYHPTMVGTINITGTSSEYGTSLKAAGTKSWKNTRGVWGILSNKAKTATSAATYPLASINTGSTYATAKIGYGTASTHGWGIGFWLTNNDNWYAAVTDRFYFQTNYQQLVYSCPGYTNCGDGYCQTPPWLCSQGGGPGPYQYGNGTACNNAAPAPCQSYAPNLGTVGVDNSGSGGNCDLYFVCSAPEGTSVVASSSYVTVYVNHYIYYLNTIKSTSGAISTLDNFTYIGDTATSTSYLNYVQVSTDTPVNNTVRLTYQLNNGSVLTRDIAITSPAKAKNYGVIISPVNASSSATQASDVDNFEYTPLI